MFRKPKKKPGALRNAAGDGGGGAAGQKRRRARRESSSSSEGEGDEEDGSERTSDLLQQLRRERDGARAQRPGGAPRLNASSTAAAKKAKGGSGGGSWMHQYEVDGGRATGKDLATRTAEHRPESAAGGTAGGAAAGAPVGGLRPPPRNKFLAGPLKAPNFVRTTVRFDYQPDICKDYKETGFCGFGDTCIYLHDRGDTKTGWQMEAEYAEKKKRDEDAKRREMDKFMSSVMAGECAPAPPSGDDAAGDGRPATADDGLPFACHLCRGPFRDPVTTPCGHYFCEKCILARLREAGSGCPVCQRDTHGVMNHPQKLVAKKRRVVGREGTWEEYLEHSRGGKGGDGDDDAP